MRCQQEQLYAAEDATASYPGEVVDDPQAWVNAQRDTWWWARWYWTVGYVNVNVDRRRSTSTGGYSQHDGCGYVTLGRDHSRVAVLIHELAHVVAGKLHGSRAHDPWFAREYLKLVYLILGSDAYYELRHEFITHKIEYDPDLPTSDLAMGGSNSSVV